MRERKKNQEEKIQGRSSPDAEEGLLKILRRNQKK
jgi:hypothetical protein